jgi:ABC-type uncharacterized transport system permease subunit
MSSDDGRLQAWLKAITVGIATSVVLGTILGIVVIYLAPQVEDDPVRSTLVGVFIWIVAVGAGVWETYKYRAKRRHS